MAAEIPSEYTAPWGGMRPCESPYDCFADQYGQPLIPFSSACTFFITEELVGPFCTCSFIQANQGPMCTVPSSVTIQKLVLFSFCTLVNFIGLVVILYKFNLVRRTGKLSMNISSTVGLLGFTTLVLETGHSLLSALSLFYIGSKTTFAYLGITPSILLTLPGCALLLSVIVWKNILLRTTKAMTFSLADKALCLLALGFATLQIVLRHFDLVEEATLAAAILFGLATVVYPLTGFKLLSKLKGPTTKTTNTAGGEKDKGSHLRRLLVKVTALCMCKTASLVAFSKITEWGPSSSLTPSVGPLLPLVFVKLSFAAVAYTLASFTLDTLIAKWASMSSRRRSTKVGVTTMASRNSQGSKQGESIAVTEKLTTASSSS